MRKKLAHIGSLARKAFTILGKSGPLAFTRYILKGIYNHRRPVMAAAYSLRLLLSRGPRELVKTLWRFGHSATYREKSKQLFRVKTFFARDPVMTSVAFDAMQKRLAERVLVPDKSAPFSVLFITTIGETMSARYQVDNLCEQLRKQGVQPGILYDFEILEHLEEALAFDIIVFQRLLMNPDVETLLARARERGSALVFEIDDYLFDTPVILSHESVKRSSPERIADVAAYSAGMRRMLLACDYFIGTTSTLADAAGELRRASFVIRNGLNDRQVALAELALKRRSRQQKTEGTIRIGYQPGTRTHQQDFAVAVPALIRILEEFAQVQLVIQGPLDIPAALQPYEQRIERWPFVSWEKLAEVTAQLDVAIAPLEVGHPSNKAKSALKYFEAGLVEVPVVASPTEDFCKAIQQGITGFLATTKEEWYQSLRAVVSDPVLRRQIGQRAREDVLTQYTSAAQSLSTFNTFQSIAEEQKRARPDLPSLDKMSRLASCFPPQPVRSRQKGDAEVSVIVRTCNRPETLKVALASLANQTLEPLEVVLVNDGGSDVSEIISDFEPYLPMSYLQHTERKGPGAALNTGLRGAQGRWVAYLDDDDIMYPSHLEALWTALTENKGKYQVAYSNHNRALLNEHTPAASTLARVLVPSWEFQARDLLANNYLPIHTWMHSRECLEKVGGFDETLLFFEDWDFLIRLASFYQFLPVKRVSCEYRFYLDATNSTVQRRGQMLEQQNSIYSRYPTTDPALLTQREAARKYIQEEMSKIADVQRLAESGALSQKEAQQQILAFIGQFQFEQ